MKDSNGLEEELEAEDDPQDDNNEADEIALEARKLQTTKADAMIVEEEIQNICIRHALKAGNSLHLKFLSYQRSGCTFCVI